MLCTYFGFREQSKKEPVKAVLINGVFLFPGQLMQLSQFVPIADKKKQMIDTQALV